MLYRLLKIIIGTGIRLYYRRIKISGQEVLSVKGAKIIVANHPNTLMDAWLIGYICKQPIYYMAKGTFFNKPWKRKLLMSLGLIPINRAVDNKTAGVSNNDSFELCYRVLEQGRTLVIFPEGNSMADRLLRKLKSGTARIALQTELRNDGKLGLTIIPVGLVYLQAEKFRSSVMVNVGTAINPLPFLPEFKTDSLKAARGLTEEMRNGISELLVDSENKEQETLADKVVGILSSGYRKGEKRGLDRDVALLKQVNRSINKFQIQSPDKIAEIEKLVAQIEWQIDRLEIKSEFLDRNYRFGMFLRQIIQSGLALILTFPVFLLGLIHNLIPYKVTDIFMPRLVQDKEYYAAIAVLIGIVFYPLNYAGFLYLSSFYIELNWVAKTIYFFLMPLSGLFAYYFYHYFKHVSIKWRFTQLMRRSKQKEILKSLRDARIELRNLVTEA